MMRNRIIGAFVTTFFALLFATAALGDEKGDDTRKGGEATLDGQVRSIDLVIPDTDTVWASCGDTPYQYGDVTESIQMNNCLIYESCKAVGEKTFKSLRFRIPKDDNRTTFYTIQLSDIRVSSYNLSPQGSSCMTEHLNMTYKKIDFKD